MVTDRQVRRLMKLMQTETMTVAAAKSGMDEKTARRYRSAGKLPSELKAKRTWRTRPDLFAAVWEEVREKLSVNPGQRENAPSLCHREGADPQGAPDPLHSLQPARTGASGGKKGFTAGTGLQAVWEV